MNKMNINDFDAILYLDNSLQDDIFERGLGVDTRTINTRIPNTADKFADGNHAYAINPSLYASWSYGNQLKRSIQSWSSNYSCEVADFGQEIAVTVTHCEPATGRTASKTFLIIFTNTKGDAYVKNHSSKWRSVSGIGQAESYIKSVCSALSNSTQSKM
jgi:hypothetical protein